MVANNIQRYINDDFTDFKHTGTFQVSTYVLTYIFYIEISGCRCELKYSASA